MSQSGAGEHEDGRSPYDRPSRDFSGESRTEVALVRVEMKLDGFIQAQLIRDAAITQDLKFIRETHVATSSDHESRLRQLEAKTVDPARIYALEQKRYVEPKTVWTAVGVLTAVSGLLVAIINVVTR